MSALGHPPQNPSRNICCCGEACSADLFNVKGAYIPMLITPLPPRLLLLISLVLVLVLVLVLLLPLLLLLVLLLLLLLLLLRLLMVLIIILAMCTRRCRSVCASDGPLASRGV